MRLITRQVEVEVEVNGVAVKGQVLSSDVLTKLRDKNYKSVGVGKNKKTVIDELAYGEDVFVEAVTWWDEAIVDTDGKELKCTDKNKRLVYQWNQGFAQSAINKISQAVNALRTEEEKN